jgi:hypothetical protein
MVIEFQTTQLRVLDVSEKGDAFFILLQMKAQVAVPLEGFLPHHQGIYCFNIKESACRNTPGHEVKLLLTHSVPAS